MLVACCLFFLRLSTGTLVNQAQRHRVQQPSAGGSLGDGAHPGSGAPFEGDRRGQGDACGDGQGPGARAFARLGESS